MDPFLLWAISYALPVGLVTLFLLGFRLAPQGTYLRELIIYGALLVSALMSNIFLHLQGRMLPFEITFVNASLFILVVVFVYLYLGKFGLAYGVSAIIQQLCMISITALLLPLLPPYAVILLVMVPYVWAHFLYPVNILPKIIVTVVWGTLTVVLFALFQDILLNMSLHLLGGGILIGRSVLYRKRQAIPLR